MLPSAPPPRCCPARGGWARDLRASAATARPQGRRAPAPAALGRGAEPLAPVPVLLARRPPGSLGAGRTREQTGTAPPPRSGRPGAAGPAVGASPTGRGGGTATPPALLRRLWGATPVLRPLSRPPRSASGPRNLRAARSGRGCPGPGTEPGRAARQGAGGSLFPNHNFTVSKKLYNLCTKICCVFFFFPFLPQIQSNKLTFSI